jgi:hypothetical protein
LPEFLPVKKRALNAEANSIFTTELSAPVLAPAELNGSKFVAAMDRLETSILPKELVGLNQRDILEA